MFFFFTIDSCFFHPTEKVIYQQMALWCDSKFFWIFPFDWFSVALRLPALPFFLYFLIQSVSPKFGSTSLMMKETLSEKVLSLREKKWFAEMYFAIHWFNLEMHFTFRLFTLVSKEFVLLFLRQIFCDCYLLL